MNYVNADAGLGKTHMILAVLIAAMVTVALLPTFLGARNQDRDREAQASLSSAVAAAAALYRPGSGYASVSAQRLGSVEPSLAYGAGSSTAPTQVSILVDDVRAGDRQEFSASAVSGTGTCYWIHVVSAGELPGTFYGSSNDADVPCEASEALAAYDPSW
jgi:type II secretory pathway pseudopilin PulG